MTTLVARQEASFTPTPTPTPSSTSSGGGGSTTPSLFFIALGIGVVFINLWLIIGIKYCCRHRRRRFDSNYNNSRYNEELQAISFYAGRVPRRRREKKLITLEELNEMFPVQKYKEWRSNREENGLSTEGGISSAAAHQLTTSGTSHEDEDMAATTVEVGQSANAVPNSTTKAEDDKKNEVFETTRDMPDMSGDLCAICIDNLEPNDEVRALACHHVFHSDCVTPWLTTRRALCPLCKMDFYKQDQSTNNDHADEISPPQPVVLADRDTPQLMYPWEVFVRAPRSDRSQSQLPQAYQSDVSPESTQQGPLSNLTFWRRNRSTNPGAGGAPTANNDNNV